MDSKFADIFINSPSFLPTPKPYVVKVAGSRARSVPLAQGNAPKKDCHILTLRVLGCVVRARNPRVFAVIFSRNGAKFGRA